MSSFNCRFDWRDNYGGHQERAVMSFEECERMKDKSLCQSYIQHHFNTSGNIEWCQCIMEGVHNEPKEVSSYSSRTSSSHASSSSSSSFSQGATIGASLVSKGIDALNARNEAKAAEMERQRLAEEEERERQRQEEKEARYREYEWRRGLDRELRYKYEEMERMCKKLYDKYVKKGDAILDKEMPSPESFISEFENALNNKKSANKTFYPELIKYAEENGITMQELEDFNEHYDCTCKYSFAWKWERRVDKMKDYALENLMDNPILAKYFAEDYAKKQKKDAKEMRIKKILKYSWIGLGVGTLLFCLISSWWWILLGILLAVVLGFITIVIWPA